MSAIGTVHAYQYGTATVSHFEGTRRIEIYRPYKVPANEPWNRAITERVFAAGTDDDSPRHAMHGSGYSARCACCYLGFTHTERKHTRSIGTTGGAP